MQNIVGISTCKGRLSHIQRTAKAFLDSTPSNIRYVIVDCNCPEKSGEWVSQNLGHTGRAHVLNFRSGNIFNKPAALNAGSKYAIHTLGTEWIIYFDADTIILPGFINQISPLLCKDRFIIAEPTGADDLTGLLVMHRDMYIETGGFEESFRGWGAEDLEFRLRLFIKHNYKYDIISCENLSPIHHGNDLRVRFYTDKDIVFSNKRNIYRLKQMYHVYTGKDLVIQKLTESEDPDFFKLLSLHPRENHNDTLENFG